MTPTPNPAPGHDVGRYLVEVRPVGRLGVSWVEWEGVERWRAAARLWVARRRYIEPDYQCVLIEELSDDAVELARLRRENLAWQAQVKS